ncbi:hypothetical protein OIN60_20685 [Paenibacillus sp. P96]|uniref:DUF5082 domain-containing protein n=1 Tax=Paenibacillus zeirhizosphaerae TaxID=2987519 RepID=A0ABT9FWX8_9BACL|nr:hypothetical protein [Paenibacillus sp. P96]MDP4099140.1 hypothetical protein [Paenibacillus sp. P96]
MDNDTKQRMTEWRDSIKAELDSSSKLLNSKQSEFDFITKQLMIIDESAKELPHAGEKRSYLTQYFKEEELIKKLDVLEKEIAELHEENKNKVTSLNTVIKVIDSYIS